MIKRVIALALVLTCVWAAAAFAATSQTSNVTVTVPSFVDLSVTGGNLDCSFSPTAAEIVTGNSHVYTSTSSSGNMVVMSNYTNTTTLKAQVTTNFAAGLTVSLSSRQWTAAGASNGYVSIMNNGSPLAATTVASWTGGGINVPLTVCSYQMSNVDVNDTPGSYSAVVTFTLSGT